MTNEEQYEYLVSRGFLRRIKEALEAGYYPDKDRGKKLVEVLSLKMKEFEEKSKLDITD